MRAVLLGLLLLAAPAQAATVLSVGDGDTIRMACIDAPETSQSPYGGQSRALLQSLVPINAQVALRVLTKDRYGRTVAEVIRGGQHINLRMVRRGQAFAFRQYLSQCDAAAYLGAERAAQNDRLGVWSVPGGITRPWDYRRARRSGGATTTPRPTVPSGSGSSGQSSGAPAGRTYRCSEIGSYERAQQLLRQGHTYLDRNRDGEACESLRR